MGWRFLLRLGSVSFILQDVGDSCCKDEMRRSRSIKSHDRGILCLVSQLTGVGCSCSLNSARRQLSNAPLDFGDSSELQINLVFFVLEF